MSRTRRAYNFPSFKSRHIGLFYHPYKQLRKHRCSICYNRRRRSQRRAEWKREESMVKFYERDSYYFMWNCLEGLFGEFLAEKQGESFACEISQQNFACKILQPQHLYNIK